MEPVSFEARRLYPLGTHGFGTKTKTLAGNRYKDIGKIKRWATLA
jgi:hypothetical protein